MSDAPPTKLPPAVSAVVTWATVPFFLLVPVLLSHALLSAGVSPLWAVSGIVFPSGCALLLLQWVHPRAPTWTLKARPFANDLLHTVTWHGAFPPLFRALSLGTLTAAGAWVSTHLDRGIWPAELPWWIQLYLALAIGEFSAYWIHRGCHEFAPLWRVHVLHHSSDELNVLSSGRNHPFNVGVSVMAQFAPLYFLGCPPEILALHSVFTGVNGGLQHANVYMRSGILSWIVATPDLHFWHHSEAIEDSNSNYGSNLILWDILFGTRRLPNAPVTTTLGLPHASPTTFSGQLLYPFTFAKWAKMDKDVALSSARHDDVPSHVHAPQHV